MSHGVSEDEYKEFLLYVSGVFGNMGNFLSFGSKKFVPRLPEDKFLSILSSHPFYESNKRNYKQLVDTLWPQICKEVYTFDKPYAQIGKLPNGVNSYFSKDISDADLALIQDFCKSQADLDILNTRAFKEGDKIVITVASI